MNMRFYLDLPVTLPGNVQKCYDLFVPEGDAASIPLLVWIHGGGWDSGEKRVCNEFERFCWRGYAVLSIDYRLSQDAPFPAQLIDCKTAIRWARAHAAEYGYNAERIVVGGSSAGGHLAALLGVCNGRTEYDCGEYLDYSSDVQGVVDGYGPTDLRETLLPGLKPQLRALLRGDAQRCIQASPVHHVHADVPPFFVMHGTDDPLVPISHSRTFVQALRQVGADVTYLEVPGAGHGFDTRKSYEMLTDFIRRCLPSGLRDAAVMEACV